MKKIKLLLLLVHFIVLLKLTRTDSCQSKVGRTFSDALQAIGRSVTTSSVLTVNFKNAIILAGIKAIVIVAGILGKLSFWSFPKLGSFRTLNEFESGIVDEIQSTLMATEDIRWSSTYMWSLNKGDFSCLYRLACENPSSAAVYSEAAHILRDFAIYLRILEHKTFYEKIIVNVEEAAKRGHRLKSSCKVYVCLAPFKRG